MTEQGTASAKARILVVEDEFPMRLALEDCLAAEGFRVITASQGEEGLTLALEQKPDLVLLDVMMPVMNGFEVCQELRKHQPEVPILILTAKGHVDDRVRGLDLGADDYLVKPFVPQELLARLRALLRRSRALERSVKTLELGKVRLDFAQQRGWKGREEMNFRSKEFAMLRLMAMHEGETVTREQFLDVVWGYGAYPTTRTVDTHMRRLRQKIEPNPHEPQFLITVHGEGYRLQTHATTDKDS